MSSNRRLPQTTLPVTALACSESAPGQLADKSNFERLKEMEKSMSERIYRSIQEPIRENLSWDERWRGPDKGLIQCWELGRKRSMESPELTECVKKGELPALGWKGGVEKKIKKKEKYGCLNYLAEWQGLRGEDLDIDLFEEREIVCSKTGMKVIYTGDATKYAKP